MLAMLLDAPGSPLRTVAVPASGPGQLLLRVRACGVGALPLELGDEALDRLRQGRVRGAAVLALRAERRS